MRECVVENTLHKRFWKVVLLVVLKTSRKRETLRDFYLISNRLPVSIPDINDFPSINVCSRGFFAICLVTRGFPDSNRDGAIVV